MENTRELSLFLKKTTNELDFTAGDIAEATKLPVRTVSRLLNGVESSPEVFARIYKICKVLELDYDNVVRDFGADVEMVEYAKQIALRLEDNGVSFVVKSKATKKSNEKKGSFVLVRNSDMTRYLTKIHIEPIGNTIRKHRLYRFEPYRHKALRFKDYDKAVAIAKRLVNVEVVDIG